MSEHESARHYTTECGVGAYLEALAGLSSVGRQAEIRRRILAEIPADLYASDLSAAEVRERRILKEEYAWGPYVRVLCAREHMLPRLDPYEAAALSSMIEIDWTGGPKIGRGSGVEIWRYLAALRSDDLRTIGEAEVGLDLGLSAHTQVARIVGRHVEPTSLDFDGYLSIRKGAPLEREINQYLKAFHSRSRGGLIEAETRLASALATRLERIAYCRSVGRGPAFSEEEPCKGRRVIVYSGGRLVVRDDPKRIREALEEHVRVGGNLREADLAGVDLTGVNLSGADLSMARLTAARLDGAVLDGANLSGAHLERADLANCSLRAARLRDARLDFANLSTSDLARASFAGASLDSSVLRACRAIGASFELARMPRACLVGSILSRANFDHADLAGADIRLAYFDRATLRESRLTGLRAQQSFFLGADLRDARLDHSDLRDAGFHNAILARASLRHVNASRAFFEGAELHETSFADAKLEGATFTPVGSRAVAS